MCYKGHSHLNPYIGITNQTQTFDNTTHKWSMVLRYDGSNHSKPSCVLVFIHLIRQTLGCPFVLRIRRVHSATWLEFSPKFGLVLYPKFGTPGRGMFFSARMIVQIVKHLISSSKNDIQMGGSGVTYAAGSSLSRLTCCIAHCATAHTKVGI
jgi:hypothetical protein